MGNWLFIRRLRKELPVWADRGWVTAGSERAILQHAAGRGGSRLFTYAVSLLGVLLLGSGVITFFAANWDQMAKFTRLALLFGSLWLAYGGAAYLLAVKKMPQAGEALLLLGVILFGANIMLIAQIYHIDEHYPDGVLFWALGGLLTAYAMRSQPAMVAALALGTLWTLLEGFGSQREVHWWYLTFPAAALPGMIRWRWTFAAHAMLLGLLLWSMHVYGLFGILEHEALELTQFYLVAYMALFVLGLILESIPATRFMAPPVQHYALFASLLAFFVLTFPELQEKGGLAFGAGARQTTATAWQVLTIAALAILLGLALWHRRLAGGAGRPAYLRWGLALTAAGALLVLVNLFLPATDASLIAIAFNLLFFATMVWLVFAGLHVQERFLINLAFGFFLLALVSRYFDTFWTLLDRSFFFMGGGAVLLIGGYFLESQRRRLSRRILRQRPEADR